MSTLPSAPPTPDAVTAIADRLTARPAEEIIAWAAEAYAGRLAVSCSFGGPTGMVILDLALRIAPSTPVIYVDTGFLFPETHATVEAVRRRYGIEPVAFHPEWSPERQEDLCGPALWERDPDLCCELRKVRPMRTALAGISAYLTGLRRDQASTRSETPAVQWDAKFGLLKVNPLVEWSEADVWRHITAHDLPYNALHDRGYPSIGCTHCTQPVAPGDDPRSGRWSGSDKVECGLHTA